MTKLGEKNEYALKKLSVQPHTSISLSGSFLSDAEKVSAVKKEPKYRRGKDLYTAAGGAFTNSLKGIFTTGERAYIAQLKETEFEHICSHLTHKSPGVLFLESLHENWWKGVLLYQTIMRKAIFFLAHC